MTVLRADLIRQEISNLLLQCPELQEDEQLRADMIEGETDAVEFLRQLERKRQETVALAEAIKLNMEELAARKKRFESREWVFRQLAFKVLQTADLSKIELPEATLSIAKGVAKVIITDEAALPNSVCVFKRTPDKKKIKEILDLGLPFHGAVLSNAEPHLTIRTR